MILTYLATGKNRPDLDQLTDQKEPKKINDYCFLFCSVRLNKFSFRKFPEYNFLVRV